ncbi:uncharacterized protein LOC132557750 [Ylistrum balloti]|uniref:uncharacterized protein LOC132557750 n=1 Tax=Ylistrum balloti TaxID=509963 RepID=UPI0029058F97|nr:uncharacterized protein LOC132557750 [Ylistrum balloti]
MSTIGNDAIRREHTRLLENVDTRYIADYLYENEFLSQESLEFVTDENRTSRDRCRRLLLELCQNKYALAPLLNALIHDNSFPYLCTELLVTLGEVIATPRRKSRSLSLPVNDEDYTFTGICNPSREIRRTVFTKEHFQATKLYCKLRRLLNQGKHLLHEFDDELYRYQALWEKHQDDTLRRHLIANRYFEAKILQMRKLSEGGAEDNTIRTLFSDIAQLVPYTSHPCASVTSLLTIFAHALLTARKPCEEVLSVLNEAKSNFPFLPGCRETSLVLITEFKVYWQIYEKSSDIVTKKELLQKSAAAAMHFAVDEELNEDLAYKLYINRGLRFLQSLANLGLGYTLRNIRHDCVTKENIENARSFLKTIDTGEGWQQLEVRWRMSFYAANAKIAFVEGNIKEALTLSESALDLSNSIHFKEEHDNIKEFIRFITDNTVQQSSESDQHTLITNSVSESDHQGSSDVLDVHDKPISNKRQHVDNELEKYQCEESGKMKWTFPAITKMFYPDSDYKQWYSSRMLQYIGLLVVLAMLQCIYSFL